MKLFNPKETSELNKLREENDKLRNTIHQIHIKQEATTDLDKKIIEMTDKLSELSKEEQKIEDFLKESTDEKVAKSNAIFELNKQIEELSKQKNELNDNISTNQKSNNSLTIKQKASEAEIEELGNAITNRKNELTLVEEKLNTLNNNANRLSEEILRAENKIIDLNKQEGEIEQSIIQKEKTIKKIENSIEEKEKTKLKAEYDIDAISQSLLVLGEKKDILTSKLEDITSKIEKAKRGQSGYVCKWVISLLKLD